MEATVAREEHAGRGDAESQLCGEVQWRRRARAGGGATCTVEATCALSRRQRECAVSTLGVEEKVIARASAQGQVRRRRAFVWRRERSGHDRVCAGYAGRYTRKERSGGARRSSNAQRIGGLSHCVGYGVTQEGVHAHGNARCVPVF